MESEEKALAIIPETKAATSALMDPTSANHMWKMAGMLAKSDLIPAIYKGKPENCLIAFNMAARIGEDVMSVMQNLVIVNGKPGFEAKFIILRINGSGLFTGPLEFEVKGSDPRWNKSAKKPADPNYMVRAYATRRSNGKTVYSPWITWDMVMGEGWVEKNGSKWQTMPEQMFMYRAASFFSKTHCPEVILGMQTKEELFDAPPEPKAMASNILNQFPTEQPVVEAVVEEQPEQPADPAPVTEAGAGGLFGEEE